ncbi:MAG: hypothetical protein BVN28_06100 [Nitrospira sp. ST-bin4]|nr:MAG: hypothetical protein BVN28_06100 [Nitrospira sp. ST-bin4]
MKATQLLQKVVNRVSQATTRKRVSPVLTRIPEPMRDLAIKGEYLRVFPYPTERVIGDYQTEPFITRSTKIVTLGSCFAQELSKWLVTHNFNCLKDEWGVIYSPKSLAQIVQYSFDSANWGPSEPMWMLDSKYYFPYLKSADHSGPRLLGASEDEARSSLREHFKRSQSAMKEADVAVWTLGLTELWRNKRDGYAYYAIPYPQIFNADVHEFHSLNYEEVIECLEFSIQTCKSNNPKLKIILSVSPIPLSMSFRSHLGPYVATQYSKSILHAAALRLTEKYDHVSYMPSYELVRNDPRANYTSDGRHVTRSCVDLVMDSFKKLYVLESA